jgi:hypothetical protein
MEVQGELANQLPQKPTIVVTSNNWDHLPTYISHPDSSAASLAQQRKFDSPP